MSQESDRVASSCPSCSPDLETVHEVLSTGGGRATVRCRDCGHVHKIPIEQERTLERDVIVSQDGESLSTTVEVPPDERVRVGEEFVVETAEAIMQVRITDLQVGPEERVSAADASDVTTFWTRAVDNVSVDVTLHPRDGNRDRSRSVTLYLPGDYEFTVGETETLDEEEFTVTDIHVRETAVERYPFAKLGQPGDTVEAKDVKRVYGYDERTDTAWSAW
ncbi:MAG: HVO_0476 family zinc finger protein [Halodesulfurarchaeum sp.]